MTPQETDRCRREFEGFYRSKLQFPRAVTERRGPTYEYNCHGLTFLSRRAWFDEDADEDAIERVLADDGFREVPTSGVCAGDIVVYRYPNGRIEHTGIVVWVDRGQGLPVLWIVSKWGNDGEYLHQVGNSPYTGRAHFMREGADEVSSSDR